MSTPILQNLINLLLSLLLALLPFYNVLAQDKTEKEAPGTIRVKMYKSVDGKMVYTKDTVINAADHEKQIAAIRNLKFDEKTWKKLDASKITLDSIKSVVMLRNPEAVRLNMVMGSAGLKKLKELKVYRIDKAMSDLERTKVFERLKSVRGDSFMLKGERLVIVHNDSIKVRSLGGEHSTAFRILHSGNDSTRTFISIAGPHGVKFRTGAMVAGEDVTARYSTSDKIKIETDESGKTIVYEIDEKGNKKEIDAYHFGRSGEKSTVILLNRTMVEDITKEDKKALKEAGVKVEKSAKKELKLEDLSYYPNPSNGRFNVSFTLPEKGQGSLRVLNSAGKEVYQEKLESNGNQYEKQLDLTGMGKGIFYLQVEQNGRTITKRLLVQ